MRRDDGFVKNSNMKGIAVAKRTYWEYFNPTELTLKVVDGYGGTASGVEMHLRTTAGADLNIVLHRPKLMPDTHSDLTELSGDLTEVRQVQCWRKRQDNGTLRCRIEITREGEGIEHIHCDEIKGLPA